MGEFDKYFTIEVKGDKGWEVVWTANDYFDAIEEYKRQLQSSLKPVRLTSPTDTSIYGGQ